VSIWGGETCNHFAITYVNHHCFSCTFSAGRALYVIAFAFWGWELKYFLYVADCTSANPRDACKRLSHINTRKVGQTCRTLVLSPDTHVFQCPLLKVGL